MSLRVLLADESDTIKKVFQLALQDFNAEVKGVHSGLDVIDVALSFKPDIIFADVLLQKKNGYDICLELKQHPVLSVIPVVLMWSSFMELDQNQFKRSLANDQLEKPFDADFLRDLVKKYAPVVAENPMAAFLNFPKSISADLKEDIKKKKASLEETSHHEHSSEFNRVAVGAPSTETASPSAGTATQPPIAMPQPLTFAPIELPPPPVSAAPPSAPRSLFDELKIQSAAMDDGAIELPDLSMPSPVIAPPVPPTTSPKFGGTSESWQSTDLSKFKLGDIDSGNSENLDKFESLNLSTPSVPNLSTPSAKSPTSKDADSFSKIAVSALDEIIDDDEKTQETNVDQFEEVQAGSAMLSTNNDNDDVIDDAIDDSSDDYGKIDLANVNSPFSTPAFSMTPSPATKTALKTSPGRQTSNTNAGPRSGISGSEIEAIVRAHTEEYIKTEIQQSLFEMMEKIVREELNKVLEEEVGLKQELSSDQQ